MQPSTQNQEPENKKPSQEHAFEVSLEEKKAEDSKEVAEQREQVAPQEFQTQKQLRQKIENIDLADGLKQQASAQAGTAASLSGQEKMKVLLQAAKTKGVIYAVHMAKKMNDPYILDMLHDTLAKEGHYKEFLK